MAIVRVATTLTLLLVSLASSQVGAAETDVWLGTVTSSGGARGIYHVGFDGGSGKPTDAQLVAEVDQPGFLALHPQLDVLYATGDGGVLAFRIERGAKGPRLKRLSREAARDAGGATHIAVDHSGRVLLAAHYGSGVVAAFPLGEDGAIGPVATQIQHTDGSGVVSSRQRGPHPHWIGVSPDNRFVFVPDLGADKIFGYHLDPNRAALTPHNATPTPAGGGARHMKFSPLGGYAYVVNELAMSLSMMTYNPRLGELRVTQTIPTLSDEQIAGESFNSGSEVRVHPSGRFVYSANRGHDSITVFAVDQRSGRLSLVEQEPIRGSWPRNFNLDPSGRWLLAAGRDSNTLAVFEIDQRDGSLRYTRQTASVPAPICVVVGTARPD